MTAPALPPGTGVLELNLIGFHSDRGVALIYIYPNDSGFPDSDAPDLLRYQKPIQKGKSKLVLKDLPFGLYAISVLHDVNQNGQMDRSILGFPIEGFGFSRNPDPLFGPPDYEKVRFLHLKKQERQTIEINYRTDRKEHRQRQQKFRPTGEIRPTQP